MKNKQRLNMQRSSKYDFEAHVCPCCGDLQYELTPAFMALLVLDGWNTSMLRLAAALGATYSTEHDSLVFETGDMWQRHQTGVG